VVTAPTIGDLLTLSNHKPDRKTSHPLATTRTRSGAIHTRTHTHTAQQVREQHDKVTEQRVGRAAPARELAPRPYPENLIVILEIKTNKQTNKHSDPDRFLSRIVSCSELPQCDTFTVFRTIWTHKVKQSRMKTHSRTAKE